MENQPGASVAEPEGRKLPEAGLPGGIQDEDAGGGGLAARIGLIAGPVLLVVMHFTPPPETLSPEGWKAAALALLMGTWWVTEAVPLPVTALVPLVLIPFFGLGTMSQAAAPYSNEVIFLFMGGFFLAKAMERWGAHRRIALGIMESIGTNPPRLVLGFMVATAFISMWISNTATAAMMLPIALATGEMFKPGPDEPGSGGPYNFGVALMLGIAYAASIGGVGTIIGSPPNALFAAAAEELLGVEISFVAWMAIGVPLVIVMLPLTWMVLMRMYPPGSLRGDASAVITTERRALGPMSHGERFVMLVFAFTVVAWIMRDAKPIGSVTIPGIATYLPNITDATIAMIASLILLVVPISLRSGRAALDWKSAARIPWGVLILFGGGLALADQMSRTGLADWIGGGISNLSDWPVVVMLLASVALFILLTEFTSNTAIAAMAMPVMAGIAVTLGLSPPVLMAVVAIACSWGFAMPAGTPPNAIVFSAGYLSIGQMVRAGLRVNLIAVVLITLAGMLLIPLVL
jgi:sodium-dependent dicarboxylate transporter 2/3/5